MSGVTLGGIALDGEALIAAATGAEGTAALRDALTATGVSRVLLGAARLSAGGTELPRFDPSVAALSLARTVPGPQYLFAASPTRDHVYNLARRVLGAHRFSGGSIGVLLGRSDRSVQPEDSRAAAFTGGVDDRELQDEYLHLLRRLWNSFPAEAIIADRENGVFALTDSIRRVDHDGRLRVRGPLNTPLSDAGEPPLARWVDAEDTDARGSVTGAGAGASGDVLDATPNDNAELLFSDDRVALSRATAAVPRALVAPVDSDLAATVTLLASGGTEGTPLSLVLGVTTLSELRRIGAVVAELRAAGLITEHGRSATERDRTGSPHGGTPAEPRAGGRTLSLADHAAAFPQTTLAEARA
ncbi:MAG: hypothetical protein ACTJHU_00720 [Mycetocola sp.]